MYRFSCEGIEIAAVQVCLPQEKSDTQNATFRAPEAQTAADLAYAAASKLLVDRDVEKAQIGSVLFFGRTPDYRSPATAIILQHRLEISKNIIAYDSNYGGCGFIAAITTGSSILKTLQENYVLLLVADTSSKQDAKSESSDAGTAILLRKSDSERLEFFGFTASEYSEAETLEKGGFKNYQTNLIKNDGQINYRQDLITGFEEKLLNFLNDNSLNQVEAQQKQILALHPKFSKDHKLSESTWEITQHDAVGSTLPLHLSLNKWNESANLCVGTVGEGMSAQFMQFNCNAGTFAPVIYSDQVFEDSQISHEI